ncbi:type II toxin-antitoxin system RelE/ParE family toxin [Flavobacterium sp. W22_SRS_FK3]|uniref:type II toxin-antitoxin system RelE/ParE family toxin n=1 Tax=Flavobacterium sp. W22_SRS_FK3 TaxID=3240275 RepID=UPI003F92DE3D
MAAYLETASSNTESETKEKVNSLFEKYGQKVFTSNQGKKYDKVKAELLRFKSNHHIIFYQIISNHEIEIIRILHGRIDLKSKF